MTGEWLKYRIVPAALLALSLAVLPGCSMLRFGYGQFDIYAAWNADEYFELDSGQRQEFLKRFDRLHEWHRYEQLPEYVKFLTATKSRLQKGLTSDDVIWVMEGVKARYRIVLKHGADDMAAILMTVTPAQLEALQKQWNRDNRRFVRDYRLEEGADEQLQARLRRVLARITDWTGGLSHDQEKKIAVISGEPTSFHQLRHEDRMRRQREFMQLMAQRGDARQFAGRLGHWLLNWEEGRSPEYARLSRDWEQKQANLYVTVERTLTPQQRAAVQSRLQNYMDDFTRLAQRPDAPISAGR